jgi:E3 ubiquitin-protein ligase HERC2
MYTQELQSTALPLMIPTPNGRHSVGYNRDKWLLHPGSNSATHLEMFSFLGLGL